MCQSHTGRLTGLWFLPKPAFGLNTNDDDEFKSASHDQASHKKENKPSVMLGIEILMLCVGTVPNIDTSCLMTLSSKMVKVAVCKFP